MNEAGLPYDNEGSIPQGLTPAAVIVTALPLEREAVVELLDDWDMDWDEYGTYFASGTFSTGDTQWRVAVAESGAGNQKAGNLAWLAIKRYNPTVILFVGVAGSLKDDATLGDVVVSTKIYNYHAGKSEAEFYPRPAIENACHRLDQLARMLRLKKRWRERVRRSPPEVESTRAGGPDVHIAPIASGEQVVGSDVSLTYQLIKRYYGDAYAVEMEGYAALSAANIPKIDAIVVRAISDRVLDKAECDGRGWQPHAAHVAAAFAFELLAHYRPGPGPAAGLPAFEPSPNGVSTPPAVSGETGQGKSGPTADSQSPVTVRERMQTASRPLLSWPTDLGRGEWILRPELHDVAARIKSESTSSTLLLGGPGVGKSAFLAQLGVTLQQEGFDVLALKADLLGEEIRDVNSLATYLGFASPVGATLLSLSSSTRVVLLVDQLDALAALVDLRSERLNVLLDLVREVSGRPNLHVVCSCREFEYRHDARLTAVDAEAVSLSLPTWDQVADVLRERHVPTDGWPDDFRVMLRTPQHLKVFLQRLVDPTEHRVFGSYQLMLDDLWAKRITDPLGLPGRAALVNDITAAMADRESLWVPVALFEERQQLIRWLIDAGVLAESPDGAAIGFSHQSLFEHARARAFARGEQSLAAYALERQDGLFVRPVVWSGLTYLRGADPVRYRREFGLLWEHPDLRPHVQHLLVEFLGRAERPDEQEQAWFLAALADAGLGVRGLSAAAGSRDWFEVLVPGYIARLMRKEDSRHSAVAILVPALSFARDRILGLLREHWLPDPRLDGWIWRVLDGLADWNIEAADIACAVVGRTALNRSFVTHLAAKASDADVDLGPRILAAGLVREVADLERQIEAEEPQLPEPSDLDAMFARRHSEPREQLRRLLDDPSGWHGIEDLAERAPRKYLATMWPLLLRILTRLPRDPQEGVHEYRADDGMALRFGDEEDDIRRPLPDSFDLAIRALASASPDRFLEFLRAEGGRDFHTVQRLLARGLAEAPAALAEAGLAFLSEDRRRFRLGSFDDFYGDTIRLLRAIAPHLAEKGFADLERLVREWPGLEDESGQSPAWRRWYRKQNRATRLRLLSVLPEDRLSAEAKAIMAAERQVFPHVEEAGVSRVQMEWIGSPMSAEQMRRAKDTDVVNLFQELPDATESHHPRDWMRGGSEQAAREFEQFASAEPERASRMFEHFEPGRQETPAGRGLVGLSKSPLPIDALFRLIRDLDARGFRSESFRAYAADAIRERLRSLKGVGLPDEICRLLEGWLAGPWTQHSEPWREAAGEADRPRSVLWQRGGSFALPHGTYQVLDALTFGYLLREPPAGDAWLSALEAHVEREDRDRTWLALTRDLRYLHYCDRSGAVRFLDRLFERFPTVLASAEGAVLLTHVWRFVPAGSVWKWLEALRASGWELASQTYGELISLAAFLRPGDERARAAFLSVLDRSAAADDVEAVRIGVAFACVHLWDDERAREAATDAMVRLVADATDDVASVLSQVFALNDELPPDDATHRLLVAVTDHSRVLGASNDAWFVERLAALLPSEAEHVYRICREAIRTHDEDFRSFERSWALQASALTNVALTLHRMAEPHRGRGLELFEALLAARLPDAEAALRELDRRPPGATSVPAVRRRSPRRRRKQRGAA